MIREILLNIPALIIALPMFFAPVIAMVPAENKIARIIIWQISNFVIGLALAGSAYLFTVVYQTGPFSYFFGAWSPPMGIEYEATKLNTLLLLFIFGLAFILLPFARVAVEREISERKTGLFYALFLLLISGLAGMVITNDIFNIYVFLEISSLATYALVALGSDKKNDRRALTSAFNYLVVGTVGGTLFLLGIAFLYILTGSLNISDIAYQLGALPHSKIEVAAIVFLFIGLAIKCGIMPLAGWLPRAYAYAPSFVVAFIAGVSTKVALYLVAKIFYVIFGKELALEQFAFGNLLVIIAVTGILFGSIAAIMQTNFKKMLAFSSISNVGYILFGIALGSRLAVTAAVLMFAAHAAAKAGMFVVAGMAENNIRGLKNASPILAGFLVLFGLSLVGMPLTFGFVPKWYLLQAAFSLTGWVQILSLLGILGGSALALVYIWKIFELAYNQENAPKINIGRYEYATLTMLAGVILFFGIYASPLITFVSEVAGEFAK